MGEYDYRPTSTAFDRRDMQIQPYTGTPAMSGSFKDLETTPKGNKNKTSSSEKEKWGFYDPEFQRKRTVASYKVHAVEGRVKGTLSNSIRWLKSKCTKVVSWW